MTAAHSGAGAAAADMLPILEGLRDAGTHGERAAWLFACPYSVIQREHMNIRGVLQRAGLKAGVAYLETLLAMNNARRLADGRFPQTIVMAIEIAAQDLRAAARAGADGVNP